MSSDEKELNFIRHNTIKRVTADTEAFSFNTAIARIMEFVNALYKYDSSAKNHNGNFAVSCINDLILLMAPFAPHVSEELNELMGNSYSVHNRSYPKYDEKALVKDEYELAVQINSRVKAKIVLPADATKEEIEKTALNDGNVVEALKGLSVVKVVVIPKRLVNIVAK